MLPGSVAELDRDPLGPGSHLLHRLGRLEGLGEVAERHPDGAGVTPGLSLYAAYLTDADGYEQWSREYGGGGVFIDAQSTGREFLALCWFTGDVPADLSVGRPPAPATSQLVVVQLSGTAGTAGLRLDARSPRPLPVLAPPPPANASADAFLRSFPQLDGVPVVDELPPRPPASASVQPVDCTSTACADPNQEVVVRAETRLDGEPLDPRGFRELTPGQTVTLELTLDVEEGQAIRDVQFALSDGNLGSGPSGPIGIDELFAREPTVAGTRTFALSWTVPGLDQTRQLALYYVDDKFQTDVSHARTLGGVTVPGATPSG